MPQSFETYEFIQWTKCRVFKFYKKVIYIYILNTAYWKDKLITSDCWNNYCRYPVWVPRLDHLGPPQMNGEVTSRYGNRHLEYCLCQKYGIYSERIHKKFYYSVPGEPPGAPPPHCGVFSNPLVETLLE